MSQTKEAPFYGPYVTVVLWDIPGGEEKLTKQLLRKIKEAVGKATFITPEKISIECTKSLRAHRNNPGGQVTTPLGVEILWHIERSEYAHQVARKTARSVVMKELFVADVMAYPELPPPKTAAQRFSERVRAALQLALLPFALMGNILEKT